MRVFCAGGSTPLRPQNREKYTLETSKEYAKWEYTQDWRRVAAYTL